MDGGQDSDEESEARRLIL